MDDLLHELSTELIEFNDGDRTWWGDIDGDLSPGGASDKWSSDSQVTKVSGDGGGGRSSPNWSLDDVGVGDGGGEGSGEGSVGSKSNGDKSRWLMVVFRVGKWFEFYQKRWGIILAIIDHFKWQR